MNETTMQRLARALGGRRQPIDQLLVRIPAVAAHAEHEPDHVDAVVLQQRLHDRR